MTSSEQPGREQKKELTKSALAAAAIELFTEHGYDNVTVAEVAEAAGVSRRTAFRYFSSKDDLVMEHPTQWLNVFGASLDANQLLPVSERLRAASYAVAAHMEADPVPPAQLFALAFAHPELAASYAQQSQVWIERVARELLSSTDSGAASESTGDELTALVLASSYIGMVDSVGAHWAQHGGSMTDLLDAGFAALEAGLTSLD